MGMVKYFYNLSTLESEAGGHELQTNLSYLEKIVSQKTAGCWWLTSVISGGLQFKASPGK
jgi:hypothetical protein